MISPRQDGFNYVKFEKFSFLAFYLAGWQIMELRDLLPGSFPNKADPLKFWSMVVVYPIQHKRQNAFFFGLVVQLVKEPFP